jgi:hypothetical protein
VYGFLPTVLMFRRVLAVRRAARSRGPEETVVDELDDEDDDEPVSEPTPVEDAVPGAAGPRA